jgi:hypothetical protein
MHGVEYRRVMDRRCLRTGGTPIEVGRSSWMAALAAKQAG